MRDEKEETVREKLARLGLGPGDTPRVPPGFEQCNICGKYNGTTDASNLSWNSSDPPWGAISVSCLCPWNTLPKLRKEPDPSSDFEHILSSFEPD